MDRDSTTLLLLALMVLGGTFVTRHSSDGAGEKAPEHAAERKEAEVLYGSPATAPIDLIGRFFESDTPLDQETDSTAKYSVSIGKTTAKLSIETSADPNRALERALPRLRHLRRLSKENKFDVEFMIATVPDPIDSHVGWEMDPILDAMQRAFEANGFVLDRFYFPWQGDALKPVDLSKLELPIHWRYPGVALFRSATVVPSPKDLDPDNFHNPKLHVVLLVGETPTRGMHKTALARALDIVAAWEGPDEAVEILSLCLHFLKIALARAPDMVATWQAFGQPTEPHRLCVRVFKTAREQARARLLVLESALDVAASWDRRSSGVRVLKTALARARDMVAAWKVPDKSLHVRILGPNFSGSSMSMRHALEEWVSGKSGIGAIRVQKWSKIEFQMVTGSAQNTRNKPTLQFKLPMENQKTDDRWRAPEVHSTYHSAMLPSMAFDKCVFENYLAQRNHVDRRQIALLVETDTTFGEQVTKGKTWELRGADEQQPIILQYPMQIGRMRAAYERERALVPKENRGEQGQPRSHLQLRLKESNPSANDLLPTFSPFTDTSVDSVMEDMLAALGRSGIRYLGIIGTDPMDILFLARLAHGACPDAQLFATQADLLFTHPDYRLYTDGMLIFSPYPLFIKSEAWMPHAPHKRMRRQFSDSWAAAGTFNANCSLLDGMHESVDYAFPFDLQSTKPAVWCLVVSNGEFWPVECYPWRESAEAADSYNDAVDGLIEGAYFSQLLHANKWKDKVDQKSLEKLHADAHELWKKESAFYGFEGDTNYLMAGKLRPSAKYEPRRAHLAELALGLDGFLGFVSLITSAFCMVNCGQYFAGVWPYRREGPFVRWSLFYTPASVKGCPIAAQTSWYRFYFFVMLWLVQVAVMSPLLAGTYFPIDWTNGLHPRHRCILLNELTALFALTSVIVIEGLRIRSDRLDKAAKGGAVPASLTADAGTLLWPVVLGFLLAVPAACVLAWLYGLYSPWTCSDDPRTCSVRGIVAVSVALLMGLLFVKGLPDPVRKIEWSWVLWFLLVVLTICMIAWRCGFGSAWPLGLRDVLVVIASALALLFVKEAGHMKAAYRLDQATARLRPVVPAVLLLALVILLIVRLCGSYSPWSFKVWVAAVALGAALIGLLFLEGQKRQRNLILASAVAALLLFDGAAIHYLGPEHPAEQKDAIRVAKDAIRLAMYTERAGNLASGVSPILPALCVFGGIAFVVVCHLRRIRWLCWRPIKSPIPARKSFELAAIYKQIDQLSTTLEHPPLVWYGWLPLLLVASVGSLVVFAWPRETFESQLFKWFVRVGLLALLGVISVTWFQTLAVWDCLRQLLYRLAWHPMATAYVRLPGVLKRKFRAQLFSAVPTDIESELPLQQWQHIKREAQEALKEEPGDKRLGSLVAKINSLDVWTDWEHQAHDALDRLLISDTAIVAQRNDGRLDQNEELKQRKIVAFWTRELSEFLADWLEPWWEARRERHAEQREGGESPPSSDTPDRVDRLCEKAEEFVAIQLAFVARSALAHLKNYLGTSSAVVLLLLGMLNFYPFQPHRMLLVVGWAIGLFIIGTALWIFIVCNKDEALSHMSGLHADKIDWDLQFVLSVFTYAVVPLLVLFSMQFPEFGNHVYAPLEFISRGAEVERMACNSHKFRYAACNALGTLSAFLRGSGHDVN